jgi:hypothetical protein
MTEYGKGREEICVKHVKPITPNFIKKNPQRKLKRKLLLKNEANYYSLFPAGFPERYFNY